MGSFSPAHILILLLALPLAFLPSIIAAARRHPKMLPILLVNIFLGWTVVGWIADLIWSLLPTLRTNETVHG